MPESSSRTEAINAAKIASYWHGKGHLWVKTWVQSNGLGWCRSNMRFVGGGRGPIEGRGPVVITPHPAIKL